MLSKSINLSVNFFHTLVPRDSYAGARVVFRKVDLQMLHCMSFADSFYATKWSVTLSNTHWVRK
jgi:hypothetical protein